MILMKNYEIKRQNECTSACYSFHLLKRLFIVCLCWFCSVFSPSRKVPSHLKWSQALKRRHKIKSPRYNSSSSLPIRHDKQFRKKRWPIWDVLLSWWCFFFLCICTTGCWLDRWTFVPIRLQHKLFVLNLSAPVQLSNSLCWSGPKPSELCLTVCCLRETSIMTDLQCSTHAACTKL